MAKSVNKTTAATKSGRTRKTTTTTTTSSTTTTTTKSEDRVDLEQARKDLENSRLIGTIAGIIILLVIAAIIIF